MGKKEERYIWDVVTSFVYVCLDYFLLDYYVRERGGGGTVMLLCHIIRCQS